MIKIKKSTFKTALNGCHSTKIKPISDNNIPIKDTDITRPMIRNKVFITQVFVMITHVGLKTLGRYELFYMICDFEFLMTYNVSGMAMIQ